MSIESIAVALVPLLASPPAPPDPLWAKAVAIAAASDNELPQAMTEHEIVVNDRGRLDEETVSHYRITLGSDLRPRRELLRSRRNGLDHTAARRAELERAAEQRFFAGTDHPFDPGSQASVQSRRTKVRETVRGHDCVLFEYVLTGPDATWTGVAYLDHRSGLPVRTVAKPDRFADLEDVTVLDVIATADYEAPANDRWRTARYTLKAKIEVKLMPLVTYQGISTTTYTFSDYITVRAP